MFLFFAGIVAGIAIGVMLSILVAVISSRDSSAPEFDFSEIATMSEIEQHRQKHLAAGGVYGADGIRRSDHKRDHTGVTRHDHDGEV